MQLTLIVRALEAALAVLKSEAVEAVEAVQPAEAPAAFHEYDLDTFLIDPRWDTRKIATLVAEGGFTAEGIRDHVRANPSKYFIRDVYVGLRNKAAVIASRDDETNAEDDFRDAEDDFRDELCALLDGEYDLRRLSTLSEKLGKTEGYIFDYVSDDDEFVVKTKRSTGEKLVGLASRN